MLVLSRKANESVVIGEDIIITVVQIAGNKVRLGIVAPRNVSVHREEVAIEIAAENQSVKEKESA